MCNFTRNRAAIKGGCAALRHDAFEWNPSLYFAIFAGTILVKLEAGAEHFFLLKGVGRTRKTRARVKHGQSESPAGKFRNEKDGPKKLPHRD